MTLKIVIFFIELPTNGKRRLSSSPEQRFKIGTGFSRNRKEKCTIKRFRSSTKPTPDNLVVSLWIRYRRLFLFEPKPNWSAYVLYSYSGWMLRGPCYRSVCTCLSSYEYRPYWSDNQSIERCSCQRVSKIYFLTNDSETGSMSLSMNMSVMSVKPLS